MTVNARGSLRIEVKDRRSGDLGAFTLDPEFIALWSMAAGSASGQISQQWTDERTLAAGVHDNLELDSLPAATLDPRGAGEAFTKVKLIAIKKVDAGDYLQIGGGTDGGGDAVAFAGTDDFPFVADDDMAQVVGENGLWLWWNPEGADVTAGVADLFHIEAITSEQTYQIMILGN